MLQIIVHFQFKSQVNCTTKYSLLSPIVPQLDNHLLWGQSPLVINYYPKNQNGKKKYYCRPTINGINPNIPAFWIFPISNVTPNKKHDDKPHYYVRKSAK
jgi:hypothetical protein